MELLTLQNLLNSFWAKIHFNFFDLLILVFLIFYMYEEISYGFYKAFIHLTCVIVAFLLSLYFYYYPSLILQVTFTFTKGAADATSLFIIAVSVYFILAKLLQEFFKNKNNSKINPSIDHIGSAICGFFSFFIIASFITTLILALPISEYVKNQAINSYTGVIFFTNSQFLESKVRNVYDENVYETVNFISFSPLSSNSKDLNFKISNTSIDRISEARMFELINQERAKAGLPMLVENKTLQLVATLHAEDMFKKGYFSHNTPNGFSFFDRLSNKNAQYSVASENISYSPDVNLAFNGFIESPTQKANILSSDFKKVGIGVVDGKIYGKMFVEAFTD